VISRLFKNDQSAIFPYMMRVFAFANNTGVFAEAPGVRKIHFFIVKTPDKMIGAPQQDNFILKSQRHALYLHYNSRGQFRQLKKRLPMHLVLHFGYEKEQKSQG
jgi:hypothetical protein